MTEPTSLSDIDWAGPAVDINDDLIEIWFERHPEVGRDDRSLPDAEAWADEMFAKHAEPRVTVDEIVRRIEAHLTDNDFDPANGIGDNFIVWNGEPSDNRGSREHADHVIIREVDWDGETARLFPDDRDRIVNALRNTANFSGWSQAPTARDVLTASGLTINHPGEAS